MLLEKKSPHLLLFLFLSRLSGLRNLEVSLETEIVAKGHLTRLFCLPGPNRGGRRGQGGWCKEGKRKSRLVRCRPKKDLLSQKREKKLLLDPSKMVKTSKD